MSVIVLQRIRQVIEQFMDPTDVDMNAAGLEVNLDGISKKLPGSGFDQRVVGRFVAKGLRQSDYLSSVLIAKEPDVQNQDHDAPTLRSVLDERNAFALKVQNLQPTTSNWYTLAFCFRVFVFAAFVLTEVILDINSCSVCWDGISRAHL